MAYFYGVYPRNKGLKIYLDLLRFIAEPSAIRFSHVTLRGPYKNKLPRQRLDEFSAVLQAQPKVTLIEPSTFFSDAQHTVFIDVDVAQLRSVWYKPDYPQGNGHITMYDGRSRAEAMRIYDLLTQYEWHMAISVSSVQLLEPKLGDPGGLLGQMTSIYKAYEKFDCNDLPSLNDVPQLRFADRMTIYSKLLSRAELPVGEFTYLAHA